jgi:hypothetical protein
VTRDWSLVKHVVVTLAGTFIVAGYPLAAYGTREVATAVFAGAALGTFNILLGYAAIEYAAGKSMSTFVNTVIGGMGVRLLILLGAVGLLVGIVGLHTAALTISLFFFYAVFLVLEILYIQRKVYTSDESRSPR